MSTICDNFNQILQRFRLKFIVAQKFFFFANTLVRISRTYFAGYCICEVPVPAGCYGWSWLAELLLLRSSRKRFYYNILVPCCHFNVRFTSFTNLIVSTASGTRSVRSVEFAPFTVPHLACMFRFFIPPIHWGGTRCFPSLWLRSSEDFSACAASTLVPADPVHQSSTNRSPTFWVQFTPIASQIRFLFWVFGRR